MALRGRRAGRPAQKPRDEWIATSTGSDPIGSLGSVAGWATTSIRLARPGFVCDEAMTPEDTVLAFHRAAELRDGSAFGLVAEELIQHAAGPQGRDGLRQTLATLDHDLDQPMATIHRVVAQDDLVVVHLTMHGRHVASTMSLLAGLPPTGSDVAWDFIHIWRVADGSIVEHWACRDDVGLLAQIGGWPQSR
jgi:predicted ester cyclase